MGQKRIQKKINIIKKINNSQQKQPIKRDKDIIKSKIKNDENRNNEMDSEEDEYEKERIRRIRAALEKYRVKEPVYQIKPIIKNTNKHKNIDKIKHSENKNKDNIIKKSEKKEIKSENNNEKKIIPSSSLKNKEKDKPKDNNDNKDKVFLNKKREREDKEKPEKKIKPISTEKKVIKKPIEQKKIIEDDDEEDEEDSDYVEDKSYSDEGESESSEEEEDYSSESSKKKKIKPQIHKKVLSSASKKTITKESGVSSTKKTSLKPKGILVYELLKRWWYALPIWPPENFDTSKKLEENKLRLVKIADWKREPKFDKDNFEKCFELPGKKYVYLNNEGKIFDFRPEEGKPSYNNFIKLPDIKLHEYLVKALKGQLDELEKRNSINEKELRKTIKEKLEKEEKTLERLKP